MSPNRFRNRTEAGRILARELSRYAGRDDVVVLALPRGGVPVAYEVANALRLPLDVFVVRKIGLPGHEEFAIGALASGGVLLLNDDLVRRYGIPRDAIERVVRREQAELERRERQYRGNRPFPDLRGKTVILIDDGLATGSTMRVAVEALRKEGPSRIVVAVPVAARETCDALRDIADEVICASTPEPFQAVGLWYDDFSQTTDEEVHDLLAGSQELPHGDDELERTIRFTAGNVELEGTLGIPANPPGVVLFAHGSGSSRFSSRNRYVARVLRDAGLATLLLDLLSPSEERIDEVTRALRFDIPLLANRLVGAIDWLSENPETHDLSVGLFGASTGGGAALVAAAQRADRVGAVVSRGGRPDLAGDALPKVKAPTLLIVGGRDEVVIDLNRRAMEQMRAPVRLEIVPGATHLFEEPGTLEAVARLARDWFVAYLSRTRASDANRR